jgi:hypothetical protein
MLRRGGDLEESRRMGAYYLACLLFKTYFKVRHLGTVYERRV